MSDADEDDLTVRTIIRTLVDLHHGRDSSILATPNTRNTSRPITRSASREQFSLSTVQTRSSTRNNATPGTRSRPAQFPIAREAQIPNLPSLDTSLTPVSLVRNVIQVLKNAPDSEGRLPPRTRSEVKLSFTKKKSRRDSQPAQLDILYESEEDAQDEPMPSTSKNARPITRKKKVIEPDDLEKDVEALLRQTDGLKGQRGISPVEKDVILRRSRRTVGVNQMVEELDGLLRSQKPGTSSETTPQSTASSSKKTPSHAGGSTTKGSLTRKASTSTGLSPVSRSPRRSEMQILQGSPHYALKYSASSKTSKTRKSQKITDTEILQSSPKTSSIDSDTAIRSPRRSESQILQNLPPKSSPSTESRSQKRSETKSWQSSPQPTPKPSSTESETTNRSPRRSEVQILQNLPHSTSKSSQKLTEALILQSSPHSTPKSFYPKVANEGSKSPRRSELQNLQSTMSVKSTPQRVASDRTTPKDPFVTPTRRSARSTRNSTPQSDTKNRAATPIKTTTSKSLAKSQTDAQSKVLTPSKTTRSSSSLAITVTPQRSDTGVGLPAKTASLRQSASSGALTITKSPSSSQSTSPVKVTLARSPIRSATSMPQLPTSPASRSLRSGEHNISEKAVLSPSATPPRLLSPTSALTALSPRHNAKAQSPRESHMTSPSKNLRSKSISSASPRLVPGTPKGGVDSHNKRKLSSTTVTPDKQVPKKLGTRSTPERDDVTEDANTSAKKVISRTIATRSNTDLSGAFELPIISSSVSKMEALRTGMDKPLVMSQDQRGFARMLPSVSIHRCVITSNSESAKKTYESASAKTPDRTESHKRILSFDPPSPDFNEQDEVTRDLLDALQKSLSSPVSKSPTRRKTPSKSLAIKTQFGSVSTPVEQTPPVTPNQLLKDNEIATLNILTPSKPNTRKSASQVNEQWTPDPHNLLLTSEKTATLSKPKSATPTPSKLKLRTPSPSKLTSTTLTPSKLKSTPLSPSKRCRRSSSLKKNAFVSKEFISTSSSSSNPVASSAPSRQSDLHLDDPSQPEGQEIPEVSVHESALHISSGYEATIEASDSEGETDESSRPVLEGGSDEESDPQAKKRKDDRLNDISEGKLSEDDEENDSQQKDTSFRLKEVSDKRSYQQVSEDEGDEVERYIASTAFKEDEHLSAASDDGSEVSMGREGNEEVEYEDVDEEEEQDEGTFHRATRRRADPVRRFVESRFQFRARYPVQKQTIDRVAQGFVELLQELSGELAAYARAAKRKTIQPKDVTLFMKRQHMITPTCSREFLITKYMPRALQLKMISMVIGNHIVKP